MFPGLELYYYEDPVQPLTTADEELFTGDRVNRTYGTHKNLPGIYLPVFTDNIWSYLPWSLVIDDLENR